MQKLIQINQFPGFYESQLSSSIESIFSTDDSGFNSAIPDQFDCDYQAIHEKQARAYCEAFSEAANIPLEYESFTSPKYYNFETDRLFAFISYDDINKLFAASEADNHVKLTNTIRERFTSRDGFTSSYSNDIGEWLEKPVLLWDHNELSALLDAIVDQEFDTWDLMESFICNGGLANAVCEAIPPQLLQFANLQREAGKALDYDVFLETGQAYDPLSGEACPPLRCKQTFELFKEVV